MKNVSYSDSDNKQDFFDSEFSDSDNKQDFFDSEFSDSDKKQVFFILNLVIQKEVV